MQKPQYHLFLCSSFRANGEPKGVCFKKGGELIQYVQTEVSERGIDAIVTSTGCLNVCEKGPIFIVYPQAWWYHEVDEAKIRNYLKGRKGPLKSALGSFPPKGSSPEYAMFHRRAYYVWRMARFHGGADMTMPVMAGMNASGEPCKETLDKLADTMAREAFGTDLRPPCVGVGRLV